MTRLMAFDVRAGIARDMIRHALIQQLQQSTSLDTFERRAVAEELVAALAKPALSVSLQTLAAATADDPRGPRPNDRQAVPPVPDELEAEAGAVEGRYSERPGADRGG